jgi:type 1 fimbriae regulatory protein FimB/type 1 fimbriae regulatory protein FimE
MWLVIRSLSVGLGPFLETTERKQLAGRLLIGAVTRRLYFTQDVRRAKGGIDNVHPLSGKEIRALRQLRRENMESRYVFLMERGGPATTAGFLKTIARTGEAAKLPFPIHPHMLRHSTGYKLANDGHDTRALQHYMGHRNIQHTVRYTEMRLIGSRIFGRTES